MRFFVSLDDNDFSGIETLNVSVPDDSPQPGSRPYSERQEDRTVTEHSHDADQQGNSVYVHVYVCMYCLRQFG